MDFFTTTDAENESDSDLLESSNGSVYNSEVDFNFDDLKISDLTLDHFKDDNESIGEGLEIPNDLRKRLGVRYLVTPPTSVSHTPDLHAKDTESVCELEILSIQRPITARNTPDLSKGKIEDFDLVTHDDQRRYPLDLNKYKVNSEIGKWMESNASNINREISTTNYTIIAKPDDKRDLLFLRTTPKTSILYTDDLDLYDISDLDEECVDSSTKKPKLFVNDNFLEDIIDLEDSKVYQAHKSSSMNTIRSLSDLDANQDLPSLSMKTISTFGSFDRISDCDKQDITKSKVSRMKNITLAEFEETKSSNLHKPHLIITPGSLDILDEISDFEELEIVSQRDVGPESVTPTSLFLSKQNNLSLKSIGSVDSIDKISDFGEDDCQNLNLSKRSGMKTNESTESLDNISDFGEEEQILKKLPNTTQTEILLSKYQESPEEKLDFDSHLVPSLKKPQPVKPRDLNHMRPPSMASKAQAAPKPKTSLNSILLRSSKINSVI
jgi:hypothetical protein